eukprot:CAMPEP_0184679918 /NCGR_PEP_ID=MMETSP0312-20130426/2792_1 /TAXON_ID=31354 /ORGANISM="Compsopogon coeruleus, Strain SAG 36.94" /LENGTH=70 /DNA_ID=CAMNT_0027129687 /DNA_START=160 /DNA_END=372 /DNA_ORIENTATION=+
MHAEIRPTSEITDISVETKGNPHEVWHCSAPPFDISEYQGAEPLFSSMSQGETQTTNRRRASSLAMQVPP